MSDRMEGVDREGDAGRSADVPPSLPNPALDRIVALGADLLAVPAAFVALRRRERALVPASTGLTAAAVPSLAWAFPLSEPGPVVIGDTAGHARTPQLPGLPGARPRFYAGVPILDGEGTPLGTLGVLAPDPRPDVTPADLSRLAALAALAADAIAAQRARERAEATAEARAGLLADVSHEMRTPLNAIVGFARLLSQRALDGEASRAVERIEEAGRGLLAIVADALDLSRFESGLVRLDLRSFSPARLVEDAVAMVRGDAEGKGLRLVVDLGESSGGLLVGDPDRLRQVILNLLSNAVKFTASGTVRVVMSVGRSVGGAVPLTVAVEDSGVGIAAEGLSRLFRRFAQADGSVAERYGGTGLGLAISKSLIDAMGGSIVVESSPGVGSRFAVALTLRRASASRPAAPQRRRRATPRDDLRGLAILVAEDAVINQKLIMEMLEPLGAAVDVVGDGAAAVAAVKSRAYSLVLMDMEMPVLGGLDATRLIRAFGSPAGEVPIVALTGNVFPEQLDACREAGMDDHLAKPFGTDDLTAKALRWARRLDPAEAGTE